MNALDIASLIFLAVCLAVGIALVTYKKPLRLSRVPQWRIDEVLK